MSTLPTLVMKRLNILFCVMIILPFMALPPFTMAAEDFKDFAELNLEELLNTVVVSASRREQKLSEAPNAMYVITEEDIKRSGAVDLPDLFRMVPGLDVINAREIRGIVKNTARQGTTVLLSSHNMLEVEYLCQRIALINEGVIVESGTPTDLKEKYGAATVEDVFTEVVQ